MLRSAILLTFAASVAGAQAGIPQLRGNVGILAGTQAPPGAYVGVFYNNYQADDVIGADGHTFEHLRPIINFAALAAQYSSQFRILGGRWAAGFYVPFADVALATPNFVADAQSGPADIYVQPLQLGWTFPMFDILAGIGGYLPTGRFDDGALGNTGFGMWSLENSLGGTAYFGKAKEMNVSTVASYQVQSRIKGTDRRAGNVLTFEGGAGHAILNKRGQVGVAYFARFKTTHDQNFQLPPMLDARDRMFGIGPEVTVPFSRPLRAIITARFLVEAGNRVATEGNTLYVALNGFFPPRSPNHR